MKKIFFILLIILAVANQVFADEYTVKNENGKYGIENSTVSQMILPYIYDEISILRKGSSLYRVKQDNKIGVFDLSTKKLIVPIKFEGIHYAGDDLCIVTQNSKMGIFDISTKKFILPVTFDDIDYMSKDYYKVTQNNKVGIYDLSTKKFILPIKFDDIDYADDDLCVIRQNRKYKMFDLSIKKFILQPIEIKNLNDAINDYFIRGII